MQKEVRVELDAAEGEEVMKATIIVTTTKNGESTETTEVIMGTKEEIKLLFKPKKKSIWKSIPSTRSSSSFNFYLNKPWSSASIFSIILPKSVGFSTKSISSTSMIKSLPLSY